MRVLHVHSGNIFGGVERILIALAGHKTISPNYEHTFALTFHGALEEALVETGAPVFAQPSFQFSKPWQLARTRKSLRKLLHSHRFDLAVVHSAWSHLAFGGLLQRAGIPLLFWLHTAAQNNSLLEQAARIRFPDRVISVSAAVNATAHNLFPGVPTDVVHAPVFVKASNADRSAVRQSLGTSNNDVVILQASRMESWKGHEYLLQALAKLRAPNWQCWIAGGAGNSEEAAYLESLKAQASALGIDHRVRFLGARSDVPVLLKAADVYCQANTEGEGFSIAFVEACSAGLPIVTSAIGGAMEIVDARNGILLPPRDIDALHDSLELLIENGELRQRLGSEGRKKALKQCDPARQFAALEKVFEETSANHV